jgi:tRNA-dihydrouridine synthase A
MLDPPRVLECVKAMREKSKVPITVKCRLGADDVDKYEDFRNFISTVSESGCEHFIVHARKCFLNGLSTAQNRSVPPLKHDWVFQIAKEFPHLSFSINGGINSLEEVKDLLNPELHEGVTLNSCMLGRAAWHK